MAGFFTFVAGACIGGCITLIVCDIQQLRDLRDIEKCRVRINRIHAKEVRSKDAEIIKLRNTINYMKNQSLVQSKNQSLKMEEVDA